MIQTWILAARPGFDRLVPWEGEVTMGSEAPESESRDDISVTP
jgi:hypothetical protein